MLSKIIIDNRLPFKLERNCPLTGYVSNNSTVERISNDIFSNYIPGVLPRE